MNRGKQIVTATPRGVVLPEIPYFKHCGQYRRNSETPIEMIPPPSKKFHRYEYLEIIHYYCSGCREEIMTWRGHINVPDYEPGFSPLHKIKSEEAMQWAQWIESYTTRPLDVKGADWVWGSMIDFPYKKCKRLVV